MANIEEVQLPNGTVYKVKDNISGYVTETEIDEKIADKADKTIVAYCSCSTPAGTAQKEVVPPEGWELGVGIIAVKFVNTNTAQNPTLKVGTADAKGIYYNNAVVTTGSLFAGGEADKVTLYIYDGTRFVWLGHSIDNNTTYSAMSVSELTTGTATSLRTVRADYLKNGVNSLIDTRANSNIAPIQPDLTADRAYAIGDQFIYNGLLYKATAAIASGGTITPNGNCETSDSVTEQIKKLNVDYELTIYNATPWSDSDNSISRIGGRVFVTFSLQLYTPLQQGEGIIIGAFNTDCYPKNRYVRFLYSNQDGIVNQGYVDKNTGRISLTNSQSTPVSYVCGSFSYLADN